MKRVVIRRYTTAAENAPYPPTMGSDTPPELGAGGPFSEEQL